MDKDNNDKSKIIKLEKKDIKLIKKIDKNSKWEELEDIEELEEEIKDLDIKKDFIGLGCSRYLIESADKKELDIEELFRNCREAGKVRTRVRKKQFKSKAVSGKAGLIKNNLGREKSIKDIDSKQIKTKNEDKSVVIEKAKEISGKIKDALGKKISDKDDIETKLKKIVINYSLDAVLGVILYSMGATNNLTGQVIIGGSLLSTISVITSYIYEFSTGKKIITDKIEWIKSQFKKLEAYLLSKGFTFFTKKKKKKKKPIDRGGGGGGDDDDDDDDDDGDDEYFFDADEYFSDAVEYDNENVINEIEETNQQSNQQTNQQNLNENTNQQTNQGFTNQELISLILSQNTRQSDQDLRDANLVQLFKQEANNPIKSTKSESENKQSENKQSEPVNKQSQNIPPQEAEIIHQDPVNLNPEPESSSFMGSIAGTLGGILGGAYWLNNHIMNSNLGETGNIINEPILQQGLSLQGVSQPGQQGTGLGGTGEEFFDKNYEEIQDQLDIEKENRQEQQKKLQETKDELQIEKENREEQQRKINEAIDDMELRGQAWGLFGAPSSKVGNAGLNSLILGMKSVDNARNLYFNKEQEEQLTLMEDIEQQAELARQNVIESERQNELLQLENEKLNIELNLIRAQQGLVEERKMTQEETDIVEEQRLQEEKIENERIKQLQQQTERELVDYQNQLEEEERINRERETQSVMESISLENILSAQERSPPPENNSLIPQQANTQDISESQSIAQQVITGVRPTRPTRPQMGERNPDKELIYNTINRPFRTDRLPNGNVRPNDVLFSFFERQQLNNFPENIRELVGERVREMKRQRPKGSTTSKLSTSQMREIADIIRNRK
jgi:hypothetical protein